MRTFSICLTIFVSIMLATFILKNDCASSKRKPSDLLNRKEIAEAVQKQLMKQGPPQMKNIRVDEIRTSDDGKSFAVFTTYSFIGDTTDERAFVFQRNEFGNWRSPEVNDVVFKEKQ